MREVSVCEAITGRRSVRRFLPSLVDESTIQAILEAASRAPSGTNFQPWHVDVVTGMARQRLSAAALAAAEAGEISLEYPYVPETMKEPYISRRRKVGYDLYALYGIDRHDMASRKAAMMRNFDFFGAPVGLFFSMDREMVQGAWLDCGMFMQNVMILARAHGLETCAQQAWCDLGAVIRAQIGIPDDHLVLSGMALGHIDDSAPENHLVTERAAVDDFAVWHR